MYSTHNFGSLRNPTLGDGQQAGTDSFVTGKTASTVCTEESTTQIINIKRTSSIRHVCVCCVCARI